MAMTQVCLGNFRPADTAQPVTCVRIPAAVLARSSILGATFLATSSFAKASEKHAIDVVRTAHVAKTATRLNHVMNRCPGRLS